MNWKAPRRAIEIAAEAIAAACLGGAIAFAVLTLAPFGAGIIAAAAAGISGAIAARWLMEQVDRPRHRHGERFAPVDFTAEADVLLLDDPIDPDEPLLLDDPLPAVAASSRVVQLFAGRATVTEAPPLPAPGELAARIEDFLGVSRATAVTDPASAHAPAVDASAALHAALADIRRSLRHG